MLIITRTDPGHDYGTEHDAGLDHPHDWAREYTGAVAQFPVAADAAATATPSTTVHDDALYAA